MATDYRTLKTRLVKAARTAHSCTNCGRTIKVGESYKYVAGVYEYHFWPLHYCKAYDGWGRCS